jgi:uncharacterized membrane protein
MIAKPTLTSAAATTMMKKTKNCPSIPAFGFAVVCARLCIFEKATNNRFTELSMSSMHMKTMMEFLLVSTPAIAIQNKAMERNI